MDPVMNPWAKQLGSPQIFLLSEIFAIWERKPHAS